MKKTTKAIKAVKAEAKVSVKAAKDSKKAAVSKVKNAAKKAIHAAVHAVDTIERADIDMPGQVDAEEIETARPQMYCILI